MRSWSVNNVLYKTEVPIKRSLELAFMTKLNYQIFFIILTCCRLLLGLKLLSCDLGVHHIYRAGWIELEPCNKAKKMLFGSDDVTGHRRIARFSDCMDFTSISVVRPLTFSSLIQFSSRGCTRQPAIDSDQLLKHTHRCLKVEW